MAKKPLVPKKPLPKKPVGKPIPSRPPRPDAARLAQTLKDRLVAPKAPPKAIRYLIEFSDGTALYAEGDLAHLLYRYAKECEAQAQMNRLVVYNGPELKPIPREELRTRLRDV